MTAEDMRAAVLTRITEVGQAETVRRVAPLWGWAPRDAASRLSRFKAGTTMPSDAFLALLVALDLRLTPSGSPEPITPSRG